MDTGLPTETYEYQLAPLNIYQEREIGEELSFNLVPATFIQSEPRPEVVVPFIGLVLPAIPAIEWLPQPWEVSYYPIMHDPVKDVTYYNFIEGTVIEYANGTENSERIFLVREDGNRLQNGDFGITYDYVEFSPETGVTPLPNGSNRNFYINLSRFIGCY